jgi:alanine dehydrogenase
VAAAGGDKVVQIGVPREIKSAEYRVGLTPAAVREYVAHGHRVCIETGAGEGIDAPDAIYRDAGAEVASSAAELFATAEMIVKVKEPQPSEWRQLRPGQILFTYLHLAADLEQARGLMAAGVAAVAYETVTDAAGRLPLLAPMSEIAGRLSIQAAATALEKPNGGRGVLLGGVPGVPPGKVVVIGGGSVGTEAARTAAGIGAAVTVLDKSLPRLRELDALFAGRVVTRYATREALAEELATADAVIGAVLVPGATAPKVVTRADLAGMRRGAVLVDVAIDQGGCFATSHATTHAAPTFVVDGIVHYCVANMPGAVPLTASAALNHATLPFGLALADHGLAALVRDPRLRDGLNVFRGRITHPAVAASLNLDFADPATLLAA